MREKPINFDLESHQSLSAKHRYYRNCPANKTGSHFTRWEWKLSESLGDLTIWSAILASNQLWQTQAHSCQCHRLLQNEPILLVCCKSCGICCQASVWQRFELRVGRKEHIKYCGEMRRAPACRGGGILSEWTRMIWTAGRAVVQKLPQLTAGSELCSAATVYYVSTLSTWMQPAASCLSLLRAFKYFSQTT